jgi:hypothetical protein
MTGFVHAAIGAAIGRIVKNKPLAFGLGVLSHGAGDMIPHHDIGPMEAPLLIGTLARIGLTCGWNSPQFWGALGAICPDFEHIPAELRQDPRRFEPMEEKFYPTHNNRLPHAQWPHDEQTGNLVNIALLCGGLFIAGALLGRGGVGTRSTAQK